MSNNNGTGTGNDGARDGENTNRNNNSNSGRGNGGNNRFRSQQGRGGGSYQQNALRNFKGEEPDVGAVLGISSEQAENKDRFKFFQDKLLAYVKRCGNYKYPDDLGKLIKRLKDPLPQLQASKPTLTKDKSLAESTEYKVEFGHQMRLYVEREMQLRMNMSNLYSLVWGQLSEALQARIKGDPNFESKDDTSDILWLLEQCKLRIQNIDHTSSTFKTVAISLCSFFSTKQRQNESLELYRSRWEGMISTLSLVGCEDAFKWDTLTDEEASEAAAEERLRAMIFMLSVDKKKYGTLQQDLANDLLKGQDSYPTTVTGAYDLLSRYSVPGGRTGGRGNNNGDQGNNGGGPYITYSFVQINDPRGAVDNPLPGRNGQCMDKRCYRCQRFGHLANNCPFTEEQIQSIRSNNTQAVQYHLLLAQAQGNGLNISKDWILVDSCSTCTSFCNRRLLKDLRPCSPDEYMRALGTGRGVEDYHEIGTDIIFGQQAHLNENSMANITSLAILGRSYRITMDTQVSTSMFVHLNDGKIVEIKQCGRGLYYYDPAAGFLNQDNLNTPVIEYSYVQTVAANKSTYSAIEVDNADKARRLQQMLHWPSTDCLKQQLSSNNIHHTTLNHADVARADQIYGRAVPILKGKTVRRKGRGGRVYPRLPLPHPIHLEHQRLKLHMDYFFVNGNIFFHTKSKPLDFLTLQYSTSRHMRHVQRGLEKIQGLYKNAGFIIDSYSGDNEFEPLRTFLSPTLLDITAANEHDGVIERSIRTIQERARCTCHSIPYKRIPIIMITELLHDIITCLNAFPTKTGISTTMSPAAIVEGRSGIDASTRNIPFGTYCQVTLGSDNTMRQRTVAGIALRPSNTRGGWYFMSLVTGRRLHSNQYAELPVDDLVISRVEDLAKKQKQPLMAGGDPVFEWTPGEHIAPQPHAPLDDDADMPLLEYFDDSDSDDDEDYFLDDDDDDDDMNLDDDHYDMDAIMPEVHNLQHGQAPAANQGAPPLPPPLPPLPHANQGAPDAPQYEHQGAPDAQQHEDQGAHDAPDIINDMTDSDLSYDEDDENEEENININNNNEMNSVNNNETNSVNSDSPTSGPRYRSDESESEESEDELDSSDEEYKGSNQQTSQQTNPRLKRQTAPPQRMNISSQNTKSYNVQMTQTVEEKNAPKSKLENTDISTEAKAALHTIAIEAVFAQVAANEKALQENGKVVPGGTGGRPMSASKGIKLFGELAIAAMFKEFKQLVDLEVFEGINPEDMSEEEMKKVLNVLHIIKQKRCGKIKGRTVANGSKQRGYVSKEESTSPTVSFEALLASFVIDAHEDRDVAIFDVPGAYLHSSFPDDKLVVVRFDGEFVDIMCDVNPEFKPFVRMEKGRKVLYLRLLKALYGCMESALLWYDLFSTTLQNMGFEINPYDKCVANRIVDKKQQTICWYVDDNKLSHKDPAVNTEVLDKLTERFGKLDISRGKEHNFLGIDFKLIGNGKLEIGMVDYINEAIEAFGEEITGKVSSPAAKSLFNVDEFAKELSKEKGETFHSVVSKLLWVAKRGRPDTDPAITFLCSRVSKSTSEDWRKLKRVLKFLKQTLHEKRVVGADNLLELFTWIDASYAVHPDARSHTGGVMSMGWGILHYLCGKQKLNTKSSTESEIVGVSDYVPFNVWFRMYMEAQGYFFDKNLIYQDNQSAIRIEKNGRNSCTGNSRHIHIRYMFTKDRIEKGEFEIEYCPTEHMLADYFTKPLQGSLFHRFRDVIMGWKHISTLKEIPVSPKERVGNVENREFNEISESKSASKKVTYADIVRINPKIEKQIEKKPVNEDQRNANNDLILRNKSQ